MCLFFFFKQKTAYEVRISDWSSDVCSSDLIAAEAILVELLVRFDIPQPAAVGADLVGEDDAAVIVIPDAAEFELEIDEADADAREQPAQGIVGAEDRKSVV